MVSQDTFLVILKLHNKRLNIFALSLPLFDALFGVIVEVFFVLIKQSSRLKTRILLLLKFFNNLILFNLRLLLKETLHFFISLASLLLLLLLSNKKFFVSVGPEMSKFFFFLLSRGSLLLFAINLEFSRSLDSRFHFNSLSLLIFIQTICFMFSVGNLFWQDFFLITFKLSQLFDLTINHLLSSILLFLEFVLFSFFFKLIESSSLSSMFFNFGLFLKQSYSLALLCFDHSLVSFN